MIGAGPAAASGVVWADWGSGAGREAGGAGLPLPHALALRFGRRAGRAEDEAGSPVGARLNGARGCLGCRGARGSGSLGTVSGCTGADFGPPRVCTPSLTLPAPFRAGNCATPQAQVRRQPPACPWCDGEVAPHAQVRRGRRVQACRWQEPVDQGLPQARGRRLALLPRRRREGAAQAQLPPDLGQAPRLDHPRHRAYRAVWPLPRPPCGLPQAARVRPPPRDRCVWPLACPRGVHCSAGRRGEAVCSELGRVVQSQ